MRYRNWHLPLSRSSVLVAATLFLIASAAAAASLDAAKAAGQIGEGLDGYLHLVDENAPADLKGLIVDVNTKREAKYKSIAAKRGVSLDSVASQAGAKLIERTPAGQYVLAANGKWKRK